MRESIFRRVVGITASLLTAAPASALACPVCALVGTSNNTWAYQAMTALLTLLPLTMVGAIVWWLARLAARADTERQSATQHASTTHRSVGPRRVGDDGGLVRHPYVVSGFSRTKGPRRPRAQVRLKPDTTY